MAKLMPVTLLALALLGMTSAKHDGAPPDQACETMTPQHGFQPQTGNSPFRIMLSKTQTSGEPIEINLVASTQGPKMRGFFIQVRPIGENQPVGEFDPESDPQAKPVECGGKANVAMTHIGNNDKDKIMLKWTPPQKDGQYEVFVTFVQQQDTFWVKQSPDGDKITVSAAAGKAGQEKPNAGSPNDSNVNSSSQPQPPSEGGASSNIPLWSGISVAAATAVISFFRYSHFRFL